jgi:hypothetical protein
MMWRYTFESICCHADVVRGFLVDTSAPGASQEEEDFAVLSNDRLEAELSVVLGSRAQKAIGLWSVVRLCVAQGSAIIWPTTAPVDAARCQRRGRVAALHFATVTATLSQCLQWWAERRLNQHDASSLPAAFAWATAMLHLFQWCEVRAGLRSPVDITSWPTAALNGWSLSLPPGPSSQGPRALCRALLIAQAAATQAIGDADAKGPGAQELMTAAIPATTDLARLLIFPPNAPTLLPLPTRDDSDSSSRTAPNDSPDRASEVFVPVYPASAWDGSADSPGSSSVRIARVSFNTSEAAAVAASHLQHVLSRITVADRPVDLQGAGGAPDVGNSTTLWEAVSLYRQASALASSAAL